MTCLSTSLPSLSEPLQTPLLTLTPPSPPPSLPIPLLLPLTSSLGDTQQSAQQNSRNREPRCWACTSGRKKCTVEINASGQAPCQRCQSLGRDCSDEAPKEWTRRTLSWLKCPQCRTRKLKCEFPDGPWPIKCRQCNLHGLQCLEPRETERRAAKGKLNPAEDLLQNYVSYTRSDTLDTQHIEEIPFFNFSNEINHDAGLPWRLQDAPPWEFDMASTTFLSQPTHFTALPSFADYLTTTFPPKSTDHIPVTLSESTFLQYNCLTPAIATAPTEVSAWDWTSFTPWDQPRDSNAQSNLYEHHQIVPASPKYAVHNGTPRSSLGSSKSSSSSLDSSESSSSSLGSTESSSSLRGSTEVGYIGNRCEYCGERFKAIRRHIETVHLGTMPRLLDCPDANCNRKGSSGFKRKDNLTQHLRNVHGHKISKRIRRQGCVD